MQTHNLIQGTKDWIEFRARHYGASEAAPMLGISPYMSRTELLKLKATGKEQEHSDYTKLIFRNGHDAEAAARYLLEEDMQEDFYPVTCSKDKLSASVDGLTMDGSTAFEHKLLSNGLYESVLTQQVPDHYMAQCQQILLVTGAERVIFICSDGTRECRASIEVLPDQSWFDRIEAGWKQFEIDLANYEHKEFAEKPEPEAIMQLPALSIQIKGEVTVSNLPEFKQAAETFISRIKTDLATDDDFANAEATVKFCDETEKKLESAKAAAIGQTASIDELMRTIDFIRESIRSKRLTLEKLVKTQKESIKTKIIDDAYKLCVEHQSSIAAEFNRLNFAALANLSRQSFETACKNKRTLASLHNAVDTEVAAIKIKLDDLARVIRKNIAHLPEDLSLFRDLQSIVTKPEDDFKLLVESRLAEQKRKEEEAAKRVAEELKAAEERGRAQAAYAQERERLYKENEEKRIAQESVAKVSIDALAAEVNKLEEFDRYVDEARRKQIHDEALESLKENGFNKGESERFLTAIINHRIKHVTINF